MKNVLVDDVPTVFLPNPDLQPEDSRNFTAGVVYTPKFAPGLTVSIDLFDIETTGWVNPFPDPAHTVTRIESGNAFPGESVVRDENGNLVMITQVAFENTGTQKARGADFSIAYELQTVVGTFRFYHSGNISGFVSVLTLPGSSRTGAAQLPNGSTIFRRRVSQMEGAFPTGLALARL